MIRPMIAVAVLCLCAAQPASAAWTTSKQGTANAKVATVTAPNDMTCQKTGAVAWNWVSPGYELSWNDKATGNGGWTNWAAVTASPHNITPGIPLRVRLRAVAGSWQSATVERNCS